MPRTLSRLLPWLALALGLLSTPGLAQGRYEASSKLYVRAELEASSKLYVRAEGELVRVAIETRINPGWHLYHGPTEADLGDGGGWGPRRSSA